MPKGEKMFSKILEASGDATARAVPKEGDLYKIIELHGATFEIRYGFYEETDRQFEPIEIYPDFIKAPVYTNDGFPFVTLMQSPCEHYERRTDDPDRDCGSCRHMERGDELIAVCRYQGNRKRGDI